VIRSLPLAESFQRKIRNLRNPMQAYQHLFTQTALARMECFSHSECRFQTRSLTELYLTQGINSVGVQDERML